MSGANDWTKRHRDEGPARAEGALQALRRRGQRRWPSAGPQFEHNYNQVGRELMYDWFNKHLKLGPPRADRRRSRSMPVPPKELSVYDDEHPLPEGRRATPTSCGAT